MLNILSGLGLECDGVCDGVDALEWIGTHGFPDFAFVDLWMPRMGGLEFIRSVRAMQGNEAMRIALISGDSSPEWVRRGRLEGAEWFLPKPFNVATLRCVVRSRRPDRKEYFGVSRLEWACTLGP